MGFVITATVLFLGLILVLIKLTRHFVSVGYLPVTADWIDELSIERYRPMLRLLNQQELHALRTQPGFTPQMARKVRIQRCQLFKEYLGQLESDFQRICMALKVVMAQSKYDRPDLASVLVQSKVTFAFRMVMVEFQLACYRYGVGTANIAGLLKLFDGMRLELRTLVPAESWTGA